MTDWEAVARTHADARNKMIEKSDHWEGRARAAERSLTTLRESITAMADQWARMNDYYHRDPSRRERYFLWPEDAADSLRALLTTNDRSDDE